MQQRYQKNNNYIKKTRFLQQQNNNIEQKRNNFDNIINDTEYNYLSQNQNLFEQQSNKNFLNFQENELNKPLTSSLQAYLNGKININTTNINQNIYNNNIYPDNSNDKKSYINQQNQINLHSLENNKNLGNISTKIKRQNNNNGNLFESNSNNINQIKAIISQFS